MRLWGAQNYFTNKYGGNRCSFKVIALPIVTRLSNTDFTKDCTGYGKGNNLNDVTKSIVGRLSSRNKELISKTKTNGD